MPSGNILLRLDGRSAAGRCPDPSARPPASFTSPTAIPTRAALAAALERAMRGQARVPGRQRSRRLRGDLHRRPRGQRDRALLGPPVRAVADEGRQAGDVHPAARSRAADRRSAQSEPGPSWPTSANPSQGLRARSDDRFYLDIIGLDFRQTYPGASFLAEGLYHHHVAANTWQSAGAAPSRPSTSRAWPASSCTSPRRSRSRQRRSAEAAEIEVRAGRGRCRPPDPDGTAVTLLSRVEPAPLGDVVHRVRAP